MDRAVRVLLADDHPLVRAGIRTTLGTVAGVTLIGEATDGHEAQSMSIELRPHVLLLDLNMPGPKPTETVAYLRQHCPEIKVLILTAYDDDAYVRGLVTAGVAGYVLKDEATETVVRAIRAVAQGDTWFSRSVVEKLVQMESEEAKGPPLSMREQQILNLLARGYSNASIAAQLNLASQTVRNYLSRIYTKLSVNSRAEAIIWVRERGIGRQ